MVNNTKIKIKLSFNNKDYIKQFESYDFQSFEFFDDLSPKQIYNNLKDTLSPKNIQINQEKDNDDSLLKISISIMTEFDKENFIFNVIKNNDKQIKKEIEKKEDIDNNKNEIIIEKEKNPENYIVNNNKEKNEEKKGNFHNFKNLNNYKNNNNYYDEVDSDDDNIEMRNNRIKKLNELQNNTSEKEKIKIIKNNYLHKRIFCHLCQEYTYVNKFYKSSDDIDCKILVKYYCSESHKDHCSTLLDFLFQCCKNEIYEGNVTKYIRDGKEMKLTNDELISIKNEYNIMQDKIPKKNKLIKDQIIKTINDINNISDLQNKLYQKFEKYFNNNTFFNELILYFIKMSINTYEQAFSNYPSQAIICTLKNFIDYTDNYDNNNLELDLKNDVTKDLLTGINYFKKHYIIKINEPEIDINKIKNKSNITISNDKIINLRYLNKYKTLLLGSTSGKIYCFNIEQSKCFCQIQAHRPEEENRGNWEYGI